MAEEFQSHRDQSRTVWGRNDGKPQTGDIDTGSLQRIADATEVMATNYLQLQRDLDYYKRRADDESRANRHLNRRINSLRGAITRLKKQKGIIK